MAKQNRPQKVLDILNGPIGPLSVSQICQMLGENETKFVAATLTKLAAAGLAYIIGKGTCPVTGREVNMWLPTSAGQRAAGGGRRRRAAGPKASSGPKGNRGKAGPDPRAEAKRRAAEDARRARVQVHTHMNAARTFAALTGYAGNDATVAKAAFRKAALALHPDRNPIDGAKMAELNAAWDALKSSLS